MVKGGRTSRGWVHVAPARRRRRRRRCASGSSAGSPPRGPRSARSRDEVDELLDPAEQLGLEVGVGADRRQDPAPRQGQVGLGRVRPAEVRRRCRPSTTCRAGSPATRPSRAAAASPTARRRRRGGRRPARARRTAAPRRASSTTRHSLVPGTRWSTSTPIRRPGPGANSRTAPARSSTPSSISTTTPSTRRSAPQTFSTSSASCLPSTKIRDPLATLARWPVTAREPLAVRADAARARSSSASAFARGGVRVTGAPSTRKPGPRRKPLVRPWRSSRCTTCTPPAFSTRTTAPTQPVSTSSTTVPGSAASSTERPSRAAVASRPRARRRRTCPSRRRGYATSPGRGHRHSRASDPARRIGTPSARVPAPARSRPFETSRR